MFTGIIEALGKVKSLSAANEGRRLAIDAGALAGDLSTGASIAVNGVCLTAVTVAANTFEADVVVETLRRTNLGKLLAGDVVNLERPMRADARFDGHIVQGHIDAYGAVTQVGEEGDGRRMSVDVAPKYRQYLVEKGSIAVDGVSLTVAALTHTGFELVLIPHTLKVTTLGLRRAGDQVNLEFDVLAKYLERLLESRHRA
jgi:riboflavin synthase